MLTNSCPVESPFSVTNLCVIVESFLSEDSSSKQGGTCFCGVWNQYCIIYRLEQIFCALHDWVPCIWRWWSFCPAHWCRVVSNLKLMVLYSNTTFANFTSSHHVLHGLSHNVSTLQVAGLSLCYFIDQVLEGSHCFMYRLNGSSGACETYGNCCLAQTEDFTLKDVEVLQSAPLI